MGKRSEFRRRKNDLYPTPEDAFRPLIPFLPQHDFTFWEPCAGDGRLVKFTEGLTNGKSIGASDCDPQVDWVEKKDALDSTIPENVDLIITNPPWTRWLLHPMILHFTKQAPTWLLFDADWMHKKQATPYLPMCSKIVSIGRVKWIEGSKHTGKDNSCWYLFDKDTTKTEFYPKIWM